MSKFDFTDKVMLVTGGAGESAVRCATASPPAVPAA